MSNREISLWADERWYAAINRQLKDETLEEHLETVIDELCDQLPEHVYERISSEIWEEQKQARLEQEASRRFAVFHVTEGGSSTYFTSEENLETLQVASRLRNYIRRPQENAPLRFTGMFFRREEISPKQFDTFASERLDNTGRVTGAFEIDLDKGRFDALHILDGWQCFRIQDISSAAYYAMKKESASTDERWRVFLDHLDGKQLAYEQEPEILTGSRPLCADDISFSEDIVQKENCLEFYLDVAFAAEDVFGFPAYADDSDDWMNIYANYSLETGQVCDTMDIHLVHGDGGEQNYRYPLTEAEQDLLLAKMENYCQSCWGQSLEEVRGECLSEQQPSQEMQL